MSSLPEFPEEAPIIAHILELFPDNTLEDHKALVSYLKLSNQDLNFIQIYHYGKTLFHSKETFDSYTWAHFYANPLYPLCLKITAIHFPLDTRQTFLQKHHMRYDSLKKAIEKIEQKIPFLSSSDLKNAGISPGPQNGRSPQKRESGIAIKRRPR